MSAQLVVRHPSLVPHELREAANGHKAAVVWFTGLPSSGKSTTAHNVERALVHSGHQAFVLDGDNIRHGLSADLGFSHSERKEHLRRVAELAKLMYEAGMIVLCAFVSPTRVSRVQVRQLLPAGRFFEVYCKCPVSVCEERDPKGFYEGAKAGKITDYTGVSSPYEEPLDPELVVDTAVLTADQCCTRVVEFLCFVGVLKAMGNAGGTATS